MFKLTIQVYQADTKPRTSAELFDTYKAALTAAILVQRTLMNIMPLTRHPSSEDEVSHMGFYFNLFNEVAIKIEPQQN